MINQIKFNRIKSKNTDSYGSAVVKVAEYVMNQLELGIKLHSGYYPDINTPHGLICKGDRETHAEGLSGFQASCVIIIVVKCSSFGKEFKKLYYSS